MEKGEKLPTDEDAKLDGYSVNNPYGKEKAEKLEETTPATKAETNTADSEPNNTAKTRATLDELAGPELKEPTEDPLAVLDVQKAVKGFMEGTEDTAFQTKVVGFSDFMHIDGNSMGFEQYTVDQLTAVPNNYSFMVRRLGTHKADNAINMYLDAV